jgi:hypothetical protein
MFLTENNDVLVVAFYPEACPAAQIATEVFLQHGRCVGLGVMLGAGARRVACFPERAKVL